MLAMNTPQDLSLRHCEVQRNMAIMRRYDASVLQCDGQKWMGRWRHLLIISRTLPVTELFNLRQTTHLLKALRFVSLFDTGSKVQGGTLQ